MGRTARATLCMLGTAAAVLFGSATAHADILRPDQQVDSGQASEHGAVRNKATHGEVRSGGKSEVRTPFGEVRGSRKAVVGGAPDTRSAMEGWAPGSSMGGW